VHKTVVINAVGLTRRLIESHKPANIISIGKPLAVTPVLPAVTCSVQTTYLTGAPVHKHGIVGNGWYDRTDCEIKFWKQSDKLVQRPRIWEIGKQRDSKFTCANICWWYAMYSSCDYTVTPRPMYPADGRKFPDCWTHPPDLRQRLQGRLGQFPLFKFWGPMTSIESTRWIARAAIEVDRVSSPTLSLVYLPHLDYVLQRGGDAASDLRELDGVVGELLDHFRDARIILLSEYGITPVSRPIHLNRVLRQNGLITIREELGREYLDAGASAAFAVADHQVAHVYVDDRARLDEVRTILESTEGVASVTHIEHERAGDFVCLAEPDAWFTYYFWLDDDVAPDYARTVDIHRKPGYDPVELFTNASKLTIAAKLAKRKLGFRGLLDVIPLDATLVKGSHGLPARDPADGPMLATSAAELLSDSPIEATQVRDLILRHVFEGAQ
jgi:predicted AlkP superfamily pyrophosphatase or phosphodiesterase